jgi:hypothetical protein
MPHISTPIASSGKPIAIAIPTCLIGPKLSDWLRFQLCRRGGRRRSLT